jgi:hypothetical protein
MAKRRFPVVVSLTVTLLVALPILADPISMGPQAMEGDLKVSPGTVLSAGYDFTIPGSHPDISVEIRQPMVTFDAECVKGGGGGTFAVLMPTAGYTVPQNSSAWYPSGDQHSAEVYEGSVAVPDLCGGGLITLRRGGTFTVDAASSDPAYALHVRWHYSAHGTSGSWSGTARLQPGSLGGPV